METVLRASGISLREGADSWRNTEDVLEEIASKWSGMSDITKSAIANAMAGTRQRETTFSVHLVISAGHNAYMLVKPKALHLIHRRESRNNVEMIARLNPKRSQTMAVQQGR